MKFGARERRIDPAVCLVGLIAIAAALRLWHLGTWNFAGDEIFTLRDSVAPPRVTNPRPLLYFLNYYVMRPIVPLDELGLRILPAVFGILAVPTIYLVGRRAVGSSAGLFAALLVAFNGLHVYHSQFARYWSLVFLLSAVYPFALYVGFRERDRGALILGLATGVLAVLAHPTAGFLLGGVASWLLVTQTAEGRLAGLWAQRGVRWGAVGVLLLTIGLALWFAPTLKAWMSTPHMARLTGISLMLSYTDGLTLSVVLTGAAGMYWLWCEDERSLAVLLTNLFVVPAVVCIGLSYVTAVSTAYLLATAPVFFLASGIFLDRVSRLARLQPAGWLLPATVAALLIAANAPFLVSHYRDGSRPDFRAAAGYLRSELQPGDVIFSDQSRALHTYLPERTVQQLTERGNLLADSLAGLRSRGHGGTLWTVALAATRGGFRKTKLGSVADWLYSNCQLRASIGPPRLDFRQNQLQIFRCRQSAEQGSTAG